MTYQHFDYHGLSSFQRILLAADGTVTKLLEAYSGEEMRVEKLLQDSYDLDAAVDALELEAGKTVMERRILLQGANSGFNYIFARTLIALNNIDAGLKTDLLESDKPLGLLLLEYQVETLKQTLDYGKQPAGPLASHFGVARDLPMICKLYRMISNGKPIMLIEEKYPESHFMKEM